MRRARQNYGQLKFKIDILNQKEKIIVSNFWTKIVGHLRDFALDNYNDAKMTCLNGELEIHEFITIYQEIVQTTC